ncbi:MAG: hypothetical protein HC902_06700 [Calothrix sp. SM1_5_4]|nr:hypothetical protein [Calothrix sp. SM1_5_4]
MGLYQGVSKTESHMAESHIKINWAVKAALIAFCLVSQGVAAELGRREPAKINFNQLIQNAQKREKRLAKKTSPAVHKSAVKKKVARKKSAP